MRSTRGMVWVRMTAVALLLSPLAAGCGWFRSKTPPPPAAEAPPPAVAPSAPVAPAPPAAQAPAPPPAPVATPAPTPRPPAGRIADEAILAGLTQGKTTKAEVRELFGVPQEVVLSPGFETFLYYRDRTTGLWPKKVERVEMLTVRFDTAGLLKDFEYRYSGK